MCFIESSRAGIFICKETAVSILYSDPYFDVFDPHARDTSGNPNCDGNAVVFTVGTFNDIITLIRKLFNCQENVQFDLYQMQKNTISDSNHFLRQKNTVCLSKSKTKIFSGNICDICGHVEYYQDDNSINNGQHLDKHIQADPAVETRSEDAMISKFHKSVQSGPDYVCRCCTQTWFKEGVRTASNISETMLQKCRITRDDLVCRTCYQHLKDNKISACSLANSLGFPEKPPELDLTSLEERLVAPRIPFMQLREKPRGGQLSISGNVVNIPADVMSTVNKLPRMLTEDETIALKFKRSLNFKHSVAFERTRPNKVLNAAKWLVENSELFRNEGIQINNNWLTNYSNEESQERICFEDSSEQNETASFEPDVVENWTEENIDDRATGNTDTVMQPIDFMRI